MVETAICRPFFILNRSEAAYSHRKAFTRDIYDEKATKRWLAKQGARAALEAASEALAKLDEASWGPAAIEEALEPLPEQLGMGKGKVFQPIRVACVGGAASPGIGETLALLARAHTLARIERAKELAQ